MSGGNFLRAFREFGVKETFWKLFQQRQLKFGTLVGTDALGNKYFENSKEYPYGHHRWVEYADHRSFYDSDPTLVPPEWHVWLHCVTDDPPTASTIGSTHKLEPVSAAQHSDAIYERNLGGVVAPYQHNKTSHRPRGFGLSNGYSSAPGEESFWTQPGYPMDPRHSHPKTEEAPSIVDSAEELLKLEAGAGATFAAVGLSDEEEAFLADNDEDELEALVSKYSRMVEAYGSSSIPEAKAGVAEAKTQLEAAAADLERFRALSAKLDAAVRA